jgi:ElaB/YqjD/DUF883 family membrane-anchored ribosome-binding protein
MTNGTATTQARDGAGGTRSAPDHGTTDFLAEKAHETIDRVAKGSAEAETKIREKAEGAAERIRETEERAKAAVDRSTDTVAAYIRDNPMMSAGIAFVAGVFASSLLRR